MESFKIEDSNVNDKKISDDLLQKSFITTFLIQNTDTKEIYCKYSCIGNESEKFPDSLMYILNDLESLGKKYEIVKESINPLNIHDK